MTDFEKQLKAALIEALLAARYRLGVLDASTDEALRRLYEQAAEDVRAVIVRQQAADGFVPPERLAVAVNEAALLLGALAVDQERLLLGAITSAAGSGAEVAVALRVPGIAGAAAVAAVPYPPVAAADAVAEVVGTVWDDGLQLSDRLWRQQQALRFELEGVLNSAIANSASARDATREALRRGLGVTDEVLNRIELARADALGDAAAAVLRTEEARAYGLAQRVFRTEINRANLIATRKTVFGVAGVVGTRFLLSPRHPRFDVCDMHASANVYGLGRGVYPAGRSPLPAHPNTLSYEEPVFDFDVSEEDRRSQQTAAGWLREQSADQQRGVLQSEEKLREFRAGRLQEQHLLLPWRDIAEQYP